MSSTQTEAAQRIREEGTRIGRDVSVLAPLLNGFTPLFAERAMLREAASGWIGPTPRFNEERFCEGVFLLAEGDFQDVSHHLPQAAEQLIPTMEQAFPGQAEELSKIRQAIAHGTISPEKIVALASNAEQSEEIKGLDPALLGFVARELIKPFIERQAQTLAQLVRDLPWRHGLCPVCGGLPNFSCLLRVQDDSEFLAGHGAPRFLRCANCSTQWRYKRLSCLHCGNEEPSKLSILRNENRPFERVDVCDECKTYCLCLDASQFVDAPDPDISALAMLPLEMLARKKGYEPLAEHPWSVMMAE